MKRLIIGSLVFFAGLLSTVQSQTLEEIVAEREVKLEESLERLRSLREGIQTERLPLVRELNALEARVAELDAEVANVRRLRDNQSVELETLRARVEARQNEIDYVTRTLLPSYVANYQAALSVGEQSEAGEAIRDYNLYLEDPDTTEADKLGRGLALIGDSIDQVESLIGGKRYSGEALTPEGTIQPGQFVQIGPLVYFVSEGGELAGPVDATRSMRARVQPLEKSEAAAIVAVANSGEGALPVDLSLGDAMALAQTRDSITEHLMKGGVWVFPILLFALVATLVAIFKSFQVFRIRHPQPMVIHDIVKALRQNQPQQARTSAAAQPQPAREMLLAAVDHAGESTEMVEEVMYESMLTTQPKLERFLNVIAVTAAAAPLLGLLGTVTGIIKTFGLMTIFGAGDPRPLISGISEALITTELGLIVAIPALVMHALLSRKVAGTMARLEKTAVTFVNGLSRARNVPVREGV